MKNEPDYEKLAEIYHDKELKRIYGDFYKMTKAKIKSELRIKKELSIYGLTNFCFIDAAACLTMIGFGTVSAPMIGIAFLVSLGAGVFLTYTTKNTLNLLKAYHTALKKIKREIVEKIYDANARMKSGETYGTDEVKTSTSTVTDTPTDTVTAKYSFHNNGETITQAAGDIKDVTADDIKDVTEDGIVSKDDNKSDSKPRKRTR